MTDIKDKIKKLLALAESPNENEAMAALLKAKELMAKNKLSESDFEDVQERELVHIKPDVKWTTDSGKIWIIELCDLIAENHLCVTEWETYKGKRTHNLVVTGMKEDAELCAEVIRYAVKFVEGSIDILQRKYKAKDPKSIANSYAKGFILGLEFAYDEQKEEHPEWALVVVKPEEVKNYGESLDSRDVKTKRANFDALAYVKGQNDGMEFNKRKVLAEVV